MEPATRTLRARLAALTLHHGAGAPAVETARRTFAVAYLRERVDRTGHIAPDARAQLLAALDLAEQQNAPACCEATGAEKHVGAGALTVVASVPTTVERRADTVPPAPEGRQ